MSENFSSDKPEQTKDLFHRKVKSMAAIDLSSFEPNNSKDIEFQSNKKQRSEKWHINLDSSNGNLRISRN